MEKICTEIYYALKDGRRAYVKIIHATGQEYWYVKEVDSKNYQSADRKLTADLKVLKIANDE